jgi:hypothetical protein
MNALTRLKRLSQELNRRLHKLLTSNPDELFQCLSAWIVSNSDLFDKKLATLYKLSDLARLNPVEYPLDMTDINVLEEVLVFKRDLEEIYSAPRYDPDKEEFLVMRVANILWALVAFKSNLRCQNCGDDDLRCLWSRKEQKIVLVCDICMWAQLRDGANWRKPEVLVPAKEKMLRKESFL